jgi:hypothetical protein
MLSDGSAIVLQARAPSAASKLRSALGFAARNEAGIGKKGGWRSAAPGPMCHPSSLPSCRSREAISGTRAAVAAVFIGAPPDAQGGADKVVAAFGLTAAGKPVRWAHTGPDRRHPPNRRNDGEKAPRAHLLGDRDYAPGQADASVDRADFPDAAKCASRATREDLHGMSDLALE